MKAIIGDKVIEILSPIRAFFGKQNNRDPFPHHDPKFDCFMQKA